MNLRQLISSTRSVKTNMWDPHKDFRSREFGQIISCDVKGNYNPRFKTLTVTLYIKSRTQNQRKISAGLGDSVITTHTAAITFKNIVEHVVDVQEKVAEYNSLNPAKPITSIQDIISKMQESEPDLVPVEITPDYIVFRTRVDFSTECRVKCTCAHFYYTFALYCAQCGAYIGDNVASYKTMNNVKDRRNKPRYRNSNKVPGLCKHLQLLIQLILKTDNGINGDVEYANTRIQIPAVISNMIKIKPNTTTTRVMEDYDKNEGFLADHRNEYVKLAIRELRNFNSAVKQQKAENSNMPDKSEMDNYGKY